MPNCFIIPASAKAAYRYKHVRIRLGRRYCPTLTIDDAEVTHNEPVLSVKTIAHLYQVAIVFGSSLLSRVASHGERPFSLELSPFPGVFSAFSSDSGSCASPGSVVVVLDEYREAVMAEGGLKRGQWRDKDTSSPFL